MKTAKLLNKLQRLKSAMFVRQVDLTKCSRGVSLRHIFIYLSSVTIVDCRFLRLLMCFTH